MAAGSSPGVRSFRAETPGLGPRRLRVLVAAAVGVPLAAAGVLRLVDGDPLGLLPLLLAVVVVAGWVGPGRLVQGRLSPGVDLDEDGITWRPGRRTAAWAEVVTVEPRGRWRDGAAVGLRGGRSRPLPGVPDEDVVLLRAVVRDGARGEALRRLLDSPDVRSRAEGAPATGARRRALRLVAAAAALFAVAQLGRLVLEGTAALVASVAVLPALGLLVAAGFAAVRAAGEEHDAG